jgi:predicted glycogen debranching enzyme
LVAANKPPSGRVLLLSKLEETLVIDGQRYELSANQYPDVIHPGGHLLQSHFRLDPFPVFAYSAGGVQLEKSIFMIQGEESTVAAYRANGVEGRSVTLEIRPLVAFRDYHGTTHENPAFNTAVFQRYGMVRMQPYPELPPLYLAHDAVRVDPQGYWYRNFEYQMERERGLDDREDLYNPVVLTFDLSARAAATVIASTAERDVQGAEAARKAEIARRGVPSQGGSRADQIAASLRSAASQFIVGKPGPGGAGDGKTVIAGYHWFGDWGRDTMISLPGLALSTGHPEVARGILLACAAHLDEGLIPNWSNPSGEAEYNTIDATLWYFEAVRAYAQATGELPFVRQNLYDGLRQIVSWHERGTRHNIRVDSDGLLSGGEPGVQLTWMDAKIGDFVVTPRVGKPVEIQALWHNALSIMAGFAKDFGDVGGAAHYEEMARRARESFGLQFWNDIENCLYDVVDGEFRDGSIRPNQIFAVSLEYPLLEGERARSVVDRVERELLTPYGLRTLSPLDPRYRGRYGSDVRSRDTAYHQGTVWPWLLGPFARAYRRVYGDTRDTHSRVAEWLANFWAHLSEAGLGQISEIFDGDAPHRPCGCIAQAWSVAEILRLATEMAPRARAAADIEET